MGAFSSDRALQLVKVWKAVIPTIVLGVLGTGNAFGSSTSMHPTAAAAAPRCSLTPHAPLTISGGTAIAGYAVLKCRTRETRRVFTEVELQVDATKPPAAALWFDYAGHDQSFAKGVPGGKSIRIAIRPQACQPTTWRIRAIINVGGSKPAQGQLPKGGVTTVRSSVGIHLC